MDDKTPNEPHSSLQPSENCTYLATDEKTWTPFGRNAFTSDPVQNGLYLWS